MSAISILNKAVYVYTEVSLLTLHVFTRLSYHWWTIKNERKSRSNRCDKFFFSVFSTKETSQPYNTNLYSLFSLFTSSLLSYHWWTIKNERKSRSNRCGKFFFFVFSTKETSQPYFLIPSTHPNSSDVASDGTPCLSES